MFLEICTSLAVVKMKFTTEIASLVLAATGALAAPAGTSPTTPLNARASSSSESFCGQMLMRRPL